MTLEYKILMGETSPSRMKSEETLFHEKLKDLDNHDYRYTILKVEIFDEIKENNLDMKKIFFGIIINVNNNVENEI